MHYRLFSISCYKENIGGMAEWLKAAVLKTVKGESSSRVRIPLPPHTSNGALRGVFLCAEGEGAAFP